MPPPAKRTNPDLDANRPSKTQVKQAMLDLQDLGGKLVELTAGQLKRIPLPENVLAAVQECQKISAHGARRRQIQYIGKLLRGEDPEPILVALAALKGESAQENARFHRLERLRSKFIEDEKVINEIVATWPEADVSYLRQLRRNTIKEQEQNKPPKNFRALFQALKALDSGLAQATEDDDDGENDFAPDDMEA